MGQKEIYGGVSMDNQIEKLKMRCDIISRNPARIMERGHL